MDGIPYTTLLYTTGGPDSFQMELNSEGKIQRKNPPNDTTAFTYVQQAAVMTNENAHAGSDVTIHGWYLFFHFINFSP